jgi:hypothetical protein
MNCEEILQNDKHEAYILNQLTAEEKEAYEQHLEECSHCRERLEVERELIEGVRESGHRQMRDEIALQVQHQKSRKQEFNWPIILKAAATFFALVTIISAIYLFQIDTPEELNDGMKTQKELKKGDVKELNEREDKQPTASSKSGEKKITKTQPPKNQSSHSTALQKVEETGQSDGISSSAWKIQADESMEVSSGKNNVDAEEPVDADISSSSIGITSKEKEMPFEIYTFANQAIQYSPDARMESEHKYFNTVEPQTAKREIEKPPSTIQRLNGEKNKPQKVKEQYSTLLFRSSERQIEIHLFYPHQGPTQDSLTGFPVEFAVNDIRRDEDFLEMDWFVNINVFKLNASQIVIHRYGDKKLDVILTDHYHYDIDFTADSSIAILKK